MIKIVLYFLFLGGLFSSSLYAEPVSTISKLMLTSAQRLAIDKQRKQISFTSKGLVHKKIIKVKKANSLPKKVAVSSVIVTPSGNKIVRVNGKYSSGYLKNIRLISNKTSSNSAKFIIEGRSVNIPVGKAYIPYYKKVVNDYDYKRNIKKRKNKLANIIKNKKKVIKLKAKEENKQIKSDAISKKKQELIKLLKGEETLK
jgi:hypothetical protein